MPTSRPATTAAAAAPAGSSVVCCGRPMSTISVTDASATLALVSCSACSTHAWVRDGELLDREGMLAAVRERLAEAPRPKGGRPRGSGTRRTAPARASVTDLQQAERLRRAQEMRGMLRGFSVLGQDAPDAGALGDG